MSYPFKGLFVAALSLSLPLSLCCEEKSVEESREQTPDVKKISESFGHFVGKNLESLDFEFDIAQLVKGIQDSVDKTQKKEPPMSQEECVDAISQVQEKNFEKKAKENLEKANQFMEENSKKEGMRHVQGERPSKLHYKIEQEGKEGPAVEEHFSPVIRYTGRFPDGKQFSTSSEAIPLSLDEAIPGFKGVLGMKEGEKRTLYIHPDLGYQASRNGYLPPNSVLIFDIEVCKVNTAPPQEETPKVDNQ